MNKKNAEKPVTPLSRELTRELALIYAEMRAKKTEKELAKVRRHLHKANLVQPHRPQAAGESHLVALVKALKKHKILSLKALIAEAIAFGARSNCKRPEWPIHAILCRNPEIFTSPVRGYWMLSKGWEKAYKEKVA